MSVLQSLAARRFGVVAVSAASLIVCCALAWWQWERYSSGGGSVQNLGYVLQWPLFGLFPAFVFLRMRKLRRAGSLPAASDPASTDSAAESARADGAADVIAAAATEPTAASKPDAPATGSPATEAAATEPRLRSRWLYRAPRRPVAADTAGEPDDALAEYNRYLAELNQRTHRDQTP